MLTSGTVIAQGILALSLPVLTRLYSPEDFNLLAVYTSILTLLFVVSCFRYNIAIPIPDDDKVGMNLLVLSLCAGIAFSVAIALAVLIAPAALARLLGQPAFEPDLWMVPVGLLVSSVYDALQFWGSRKKRFALITQTRVTRAVGGAGSQIALGGIQASAFGLIMGQVVYSGLGAVGLLGSLIRNDRAAVRAISRSSLVRTAFDYRKFPIFSVPEALFNSAGLELSILIIAATAVGPEAGFLMLAMRVMGLPMGLVGASIAQVYLAEASQKLREGELASFTRRMMWVLVRTGAPLLGLAAIACPFLFPLIFGSEWARAGVIVAWLAPMCILQFVAAPVSMVLHVIGKLAAAMWLQIIGGVVRVGAVFAAAHLAPGLITETFAVFSAIFYLGMIALIYVFLSQLDRD